MRLAIRNIIHDKVRFVITLAGIAFSAFLMMFQGSLLAGFERAASRVIDSVEADLWVMPRGVQAFDFSPPFRADYAATAQGIPGVACVRKIVSGIAFWQRPNGTSKTVVIVGPESGIAGGLPLSREAVFLPENVLIDESDLATLGMATLPEDVEINNKRRHVQGAISGFGSFLGSPYVFGSLSDARSCLGLDRERAMFLVLRVGQPGRLTRTQEALRARIPEVDVLTKEEFSLRAKIYWTTQTGAGGALLTAALLGFIVGVLIVSQTVYATTMENLEEFATLRALGATRLFLVRLVVTQALIATIVGCGIGMLITVPIVRAARSVISWIHTPWQLPVALGAATLLLAAFASVLAIRAAIAVEPGRVFRA